MYYKYESRVLYLRNTLAEGYVEYIPYDPLYTSSDPGSTTEFRDVITVVTEERPLVLPGSCHNMFNNCTALTTVDANGWDTSGVYSMIAMFANCGSLVSLDLSDFNTSYCTYFTSMFSGCGSLTSLDISSFTFNGDYNPVVTNMFRGSRKLAYIYNRDNWLEKWSVYDADNAIFEDCWSLPGYSSAKTTLAMAKPFDEGGYFTAPPAKWKPHEVWVKENNVWHRAEVYK